MGTNDGDSVDDKNNALYYIQFCKKLTSINLFDRGEQKVKYISYIKYLPNLNLFCMLGTSVDVDDLMSVADILRRFSGEVVASKYALILADENTAELILQEQSISREVFQGLSSFKKLKNLFLHGIELVDESGRELSVEESNTEFNNVLKKLSSLEKLDLCGTKITSIDFVYDSESQKVLIPNLRVLNLLWTQVKNLSNLEHLSKIKGIAINNEAIDLTSIQKTISSCVAGADNGFLHGFNGLYIGNANLLKKLEDCISVTNISCYSGNWVIDFINLDLDLSQLSALKTVKMTQLNLKSVKLPNSVTSVTFVDCSCFPDLSNLDNLNYIEFEKGRNF